MESKSFEELWSEFMALGWSGNMNLNSPWNSDLVDTQIFPGTFLRRVEGKWIFYFLPVATKLILPPPWPRLWSEFNTWGGGSMQPLLKGGKVKSRVEYFGRVWFKIACHIESKLCGGPEFENIWVGELQKILNLGTGDFREWMEEKHDFKLDSWIYENLEDRKEI